MKIAAEMEKLNAMETEENKGYVRCSMHVAYFFILFCVCFISLSLSVLQQLRALVAMNESLKKQEQQFKAHLQGISHRRAVR